MNNAQLERQLVETDLHARDLYKRLTGFQASYLETLVRLYDLIEDDGTETALAWLDDEISRHASFHIGMMLEIVALDPGVVEVSAGD